MESVEPAQEESNEGIVVVEGQSTTVDDDCPPTGRGTGSDDSGGGEDDSTVGGDDAAAGVMQQAAGPGVVVGGGGGDVVNNDGDERRRAFFESLKRDRAAAGMRVKEWYAFTARTVRQSGNVVMMSVCLPTLLGCPFVLGGVLSSDAFVGNMGAGGHARTRRTNVVVCLVIIMVVAVRACRYGWHFPELLRLAGDDLQYARLCLRIGCRERVHSLDLSDIVPADVEAAVKQAAAVSMGTEISNNDLVAIHGLCERVIALHEVGLD